MHPDHREMRQLELSRNQVHFREVNERVAELNEGTAGAGALSFVCECGNGDCLTPVDLTRGEYERIRCAPGRFLIVPDHGVPAVERVVENNGRFAVVEKIGTARAFAVARSSRPSAEPGRAGDAALAARNRLAFLSGLGNDYLGDAERR